MDTVYLKDFFSKKMVNPTAAKDSFLFTFSHTNRASEREQSNPLAVVKVNLLDSGLMSIKKSFVISGIEMNNIDFDLATSEHLKAQSAMNKAESFIHKIERELGIKFNLSAGDEFISNTSVEMVEKRLSLLTQKKEPSYDAYSYQDDFALSM